jgi:hypothetical protein
VTTSACLFLSSVVGHSGAGRLSLQLPTPTYPEPHPLLDLVTIALFPALVYAAFAVSRYCRTLRRALVGYVVATGVAGYLTVSAFSDHFGNTWAPFEILVELWLGNLPLLCLWTAMGMPAVSVLMGWRPSRCGYRRMAWPVLLLLASVLLYAAGVVLQSRNGLDPPYGMFWAGLIAQWVAYPTALTAFAEALIRSGAGQGRLEPR